MKLKVKSLKKAWKIVDLIVPIYNKDEEASSKAGYPIYTNDFGEQISDLGNRIEINTGRKMLIIWISQKTMSKKQIKHCLKKEILRLSEMQASEELPFKERCQASNQILDIASCLLRRDAKHYDN